MKPSKFNAPSRFTPFFLTGPEWQPLAERRLPGADGVQTTVIHPGALVTVRALALTGALSFVASRYRSF